MTPRTPCSKPLSRPGSAATPCARVKITSAWLYRIAYRTALDMLRAAKRAANYPTPQPLEQDPGISDELRAALNALSPLDRALMLERVLDDMDYAALARIHGLPAPYLRTRYSRAKAKLAAILKEGEHDDL